jgi:hypothetical protein
MLVLIRWQDRTMAVPLSQLAAVDPDDSTAEAIADWHYCGARLLFLTYARLPKAHEQRRHIDTKIAELRAVLTGGPTEPAATVEPPARKHKRFSAASMQKMAMAQRARWAKLWASLSRQRQPKHRRQNVESAKRG